jgi:hypothetical protein
MLACATLTVHRQPSVNQGAFFCKLRKKTMWKIVVGFIAFAGLALFVLSKGGDIDISGEKHGIETGHAAPAAAASAPK